MRHRGIRAAAPQRFQACTTDSLRDLPIARNRLDRKFAAGRPNQVWPGLHCLRAKLRRGLYLAVVRDLFDLEDRRLGDA